MKKVTLDFNQAVAQIKPIHGINNARVNYNGQPLPEFQAAGIPFCRTHDTAGPFGGTHFVDIPNLFPNFDADPDDPKSYDFAFTDAFLKSVIASGTQIFFRLGTTIENQWKLRAYNIMPPADYDKWAKICEMIIRHYNEGWNDGYNWNIQYWEIWNEPENPPMWQGTMQQFFDLYETAAKHLKQCFPDLKFGGYASCGFYALNRTDAGAQSDFYKSFITWFNEFLKFVVDRQIPLDFFSWHLYTSFPDEIAVHAEYVQRRLQDFGLDHVENIFNEWNYIRHVNPGEDCIFDMQKNNIGAAFTAASFCVIQNSPIDKAMFYDALPTRRYGAFYEFPSLNMSKTGMAFVAFNALYKLGTQTTAVTEKNSDIYACAAKNDQGEKAAIIVNNSNLPVQLQLELNGATAATSMKMLAHELRLAPVVPPKNNMLSLPAFSSALVTFE